MAIDQAGENERTLSFDGLFGEDGAVGHVRDSLAHGDDGVALHHYETIFEDAAVRVHGDKGAAGDEQVHKIAAFNRRLRLPRCCHLPLASLAQQEETNQSWDNI